MNTEIIEALKKIEQMSDPGSYKNAIIDMKQIASKALKEYSESNPMVGGKTADSRKGVELMINSIREDIILNKISDTEIVDRIAKNYIIIKK